MRATERRWRERLGRKSRRAGWRRRFSRRHGSSWRLVVVCGLAVVGALGVLYGTGGGGGRALSEEYAGAARVLDGDTLEVGGVRIRLSGIDAPESRQKCWRGRVAWACGAKATKELKRRLEGEQVVCRGSDGDRYGRVIAVCKVRGEDVGSWMVREGWALAYRRYSDVYVPEEQDARGREVGLWGSVFVAPWNWRRGQRLQ